jgi:hypothetical protein
MATTNPITQIRTAIEAAVGAHWDSLPNDNAAKVKVNNRWGANRAKPAARLTADFPAVDIRPAQEQNQNDIKFSSGTGVFVRSWELGLATDERPWDDPAALDEAEWQLVRAATKMLRDKLGLPELVVAVAIPATRQTPADQQPQQQGAARWSGAVVVAVKFQVKQSDLIPT